MDFRVLGPLEVDAGAGPAPLGGAKQRTVLAYLVLHPATPVSAERLIDAVWDDEPPAAARNVVQTYVSRLRKVLGADRLTQRAGGYVLHALDEEIDARLFTGLVSRARAAAPEEATLLYRQAEALWRGPALADLADQPCLRAEVQGLADLRLTALEERFLADLALGRHVEVVPELEELAERHPVRESFWILLMTALYRAGRQADALAAYRRARGLLVVEHGLEPGPELRRLETLVLRQDPALDAPRRAKGMRLLERLGSGSTSVVHRAIQPRTGREVAVKVIGAPHANNPAFIRRFEVDSQRLVRLEHPHVVPVYDAWREPDGAYLVMRLLSGGSLADRPVSSDRIPVVAEQLCSALAAAHRAGVVHGNISLGNVLLDQEGNAYLGDFGVGTADTSDTSADVIALGHLLTGLAAHDGHPGFVEVAQRAAAGGFPDAVALTGALAGSAGPAASRNPYKGLRPFLEPDAPDFDGRDQLVEQLGERLRSGRLLALVGPSGCGKSSVVRAGLLPLMRERGYFVVDVVPGDDPFAALAEALTSVLPAAPDNLAERLRGTARLPSELLPGPLVLVVDQLEELFLSPAADTARFLELLGAADDADDVRVVLTLRADVLDRPLADPAFAPLLREGTEIVLPLSAEELGDAIVGPARRAGVGVEPGLVAALVADVRGQPGALPLLQFTLAELFDRRDGQGQLTVAAYRQLGGVAGAVARGAEELYSLLDPSAQHAAQQLLLRLVAASPRGWARRRVRTSELVPASVDPADAEEVVAALDSRRLLAFDRDPESREPTVEIAHDSLLVEWARLRDWLEEASDQLREQDRVARAAREWDDAGRDPSFLLRGARLERAERLSAPDGLREQEFLSASTADRDRVAASERRSVRRLRGLVAVLAVGVVVAGAVTWFALDQRAAADSERRTAEQRELASAAVAELDVDAERSILLALAAVRVARAGGGEVLPETVDALHRALGASRISLRVPGIGGALDWSPDGSLFLTEGPEESGVVEIREAATGEVLRSFPGHDVDVNTVAFGAGGSLLGTGGDDGIVQVWDPHTGELVQRLDGGVGGSVWGVSFSPDGRRVAAAYWSDASVKIFDVRSGRLLLDISSRVIGFPGLTTSFSPDGARLVVPNVDGGATVVDSRTGRALVTLGGEGALDADYSPDGRWITLAGSGPVIRLHDADSGRLLHTGTGHRGDLIQADWSPDGRLLATGASDGVAKVWHVGRDGLLTEGLSIIASETGGGVWVAFGPDGSRLMTGDQALTAVKIWDVGAAGDAEWTAVPTEGPATSVAFLPDSEAFPDSTALVVGGDHAGVYDATDGARRLLLTESEVSTAASAVDTVVVVAGREVLAWDVDGSELFAREVSADTTAVAVSRDASYVAITSGLEPVTVVDRRGDDLATVPLDTGYAVTAVSFSPDGRLLAVAVAPTDRNRPGGGRIEVWDWRRGTTVHSLPVDAAAISFAPGGDVVAAAAEFGPPRIWDLASGRELARLTGHTGAVTDIEFGPDGDVVATASSDGTIRLWDEQGRLELLLRGHESEVVDISFAADGTRLASAGGDGTARVWALDVDDLVSRARRELTRELTEAECVRFPTACP